ncbi:hypothetical protein C0R01_11175 [Streptomyces albidoflavus]|nr:hypothetical protein C0R00_11325 [Streptomyces albidoflavus]RZE79933.1 hypothetical protein C0R01_11175 [Streptomyces albidoflavus]
MELGDVPAWLALALSAAAIAISVKAQRDGRRSADASERSAKAAEETLADQRRQEADRRAAEEAAAVPRALLRVTHVSRDLFRLHNDGTGAAHNVTFVEEDLPAVFRLKGAGDVSLQAGEAVDFLMAGAWGKPIPPQLFAKWEGQVEPLPIQVPPRGNA